ncbi:jg19063 [Pararge aegeria aegeria]|uniref:Jg19063 protein n=1 Tax=Pararge aegeria aegeria TaxID=348720 RepID=A0A8S4SRR3_9NEOP|nr:jg19063 [Pararge aegeria aegeria]
MKTENNFSWESDLQIYPKYAVDRCSICSGKAEVSKVLLASKPALTGTSFMARSRLYLKLSLHSDLCPRGESGRAAPELGDVILERTLSEP